MEAKEKFQKNKFQMPNEKIPNKKIPNSKTRMLFGIWNMKKIKENIQVFTNVGEIAAANSEKENAS